MIRTALIVFVIAIIYFLIPSKTVDDFMREQAEEINICVYPNVYLYRYDGIEKHLEVRNGQLHLKEPPSNIDPVKEHYWVMSWKIYQREMQFGRD